MTLKININEQYVSAFMAYLKTLKYVSNVEIIQEKTQKESTAEGFRRAAQDSEMFELAESGIDDFLKLTELWNNETFVLIPKTSTNGLSQDSEAICFQIRVLAKERLMPSVGQITQRQLEEIAGAVNGLFEI